MLLSFWICFNSSCTTTNWWCKSVLWLYPQWNELMDSRLDYMNAKTDLPEVSPGVRATGLWNAPQLEKCGWITLVALLPKKRAHCPKIHPDFWLLAWFVDRQPRPFCTEDMDIDFELVGICFYLAGESFGTFISVIFGHVKWNPTPSASGCRLEVCWLGDTR